MERFKTLRGVILGADGAARPFSEDLALVLGLAAERVKSGLAQDEETLYVNTRRLAVVSVVVILGIAALAMWYVQGRGVDSSLPWIVGGTVVALLAVALLVILAPRTERFGVQDEHAAVTRVGLFFWPIGILPLSAERSVLWDPLTGTDDPLPIMELPAGLGLEQEAALERAEHPQEAFQALLAFHEQLTALHPTPVRWVGNEPDSSAQQLGNELADLWQQMVPLPLERAQSAIRLSEDQLDSGWEQVGEAGHAVHTFHATIEELRARLDSYQTRAETLVDLAREAVIEQGWQNLARVQEDQATHFTPAEPLPALGNRPLPTVPHATLLRTPSSSAEEVAASVEGLAAALAPLDRAIAAERQALEAEEQAVLAATERRFVEQRRVLADDERALATLDSEILKLARILDEHQARISETSTLVQHGFRGIAEAPLPALQQQVDNLYSAVGQANGLIGDVNAKIELAAVEATLAQLKAATDRAHAEWRRLAEEMPRRSTEVRERVDRILETLTRLAANPQAADTATLQGVQNSVKEIERVARVVVSWTATQQDPIEPVEDKDEELGAHLVALRDQRHKLESASATLTALSSADSGRPVTLPDALQQLETALGRFIRLSEESTSAVAAMNNSAETVRQQAALIGKLLQERERLRQAHQQKLAAFQQAEEEERAAIRAHWREAHERLTQQRAGLDRLPQAVGQRLAEVRQRPELRDSGVISDEALGSWPDRVINQMGYAIELWGQRVAGIEGRPEGSTLLEQLREQLETCYRDIRSRAVPTALDPAAHPLEPQVCFVPFWYVETEDQPGAAKDGGRCIHLFPPLSLERYAPTETPRIAQLRYHEMTRRLLAYLRRDFVDGAEPLESLSFDPAVLTEAGQRLDFEAAAVPVHEVATALAQHWVFFRSPDPALTRIIQNSRDRLIPESQIMEAWAQSMQRPAPPPALQGPRPVPLPPEEAPTVKHVTLPRDGPQPVSLPPEE